MAGSPRVVGVDLGTSALKLLSLGQDGSQDVVRAEYPRAAAQESPAAWMKALAEAFSELAQRRGLEGIEALCPAGQTNTYLFWREGVSEEEIPVVGWSSGGGGEESAELLARFPQSYYIEHIAMPHPRLASYPLPKLTWARVHLPQAWQAASRILQPKDYLYYRLTGEWASDPWTWRGLAHVRDGTFHDKLLRDFAIPRGRLPALADSWSAPGRLGKEAAARCGLKPGLPVFLGCSDFFSSTIGIGAIAAGTSFDITGTSEHVGMITSRLVDDTPLVSSPHLVDYVHYGVTGNSGRSLAWITRLLGEASIEAVQQRAEPAGRNPAREPLFLPYLAGERAPLFDPEARAVFFGLNENHTAADLAYAVLEGTCFSAFHVWETLGAPGTTPLRVGGGAAGLDLLNAVKSSLFGLPFMVIRQPESAALGAALLAARGLGWYPDLPQAVAAHVDADRVVDPDLRRRRVLSDRFRLYRRLAGELSPAWRELGRIAGKDHER